MTLLFTEIQCSSTNLELENGIVKCTNKNKFLSKCSFSCNVGYEMDEVITSAVCTASRAWTDNKPTCIKKECDFNDKRIIKVRQYLITRKGSQILRRSKFVKYNVLTR